MRSARRSVDSDSGVISIEIQDFDKEKPPQWGELGYAKNRPAPFDFERLTRFMAYGFFMAPIQFQWFRFLSRAFPITKTSATGPAFKRVAVDQLMFAPFGEPSKAIWRICGVLLLIFIFQVCFAFSLS